ncbi:hypothetical protein BC834DRAFT_112963 [Gloeopeniophorella convolvens]|nr:hypothetical protein BC834DRAFT_112963 [Gloeopeniophorella convolvens]
MADFTNIDWTANGTVCKAQQLISSLELNPTITCLTHGQSIGLALTAEASFISLSAVLVVFILIWRNVRRYQRSFPNGGWRLLRVPFDIYMLSLFGFDIMQAMGGVLDVRWAHGGIVRTGSYCTAQGVIQQIGELGVALITIILTVHTFVAAIWRVGLRACRFAFAIVGLAWVFVALWVGIGPSIHKHYEAPTPYWCWISSQFSGQRLAGEYIWIWFALFSSLVMYILLYFWTEGRLSVDEDKWYKFYTHKPEQRLAYSQRRAALGMLAYPLAYSVVVLPVSVARWLLFNHQAVPSAVTFLAVSIFNLSGAINVLLLVIIRPRLLLFIPPGSSVKTEANISQPALNNSAAPAGATKSDQNLPPTAVGLDDDMKGQVRYPNPGLPGNNMSFAHDSSGRMPGNP